jgi:hypothetical protein
MELIYLEPTSAPRCPDSCLHQPRCPGAERGRPAGQDPRLADPAARYTDLGYGYYQARTDVDRKRRNHIRQTQALGFAVTLTRAA